MIKDVFHADCDFCGEVKLVATSPKGVFCKDCWELIKDMADECIDKIELQEELENV